MEPYSQIFSLSDKTALVVGASRGIGLAIAQALATAGAHTILAARSVDKLHECAAVIHSAGHAASTLELDVTNSDSIRAAAGSLDAVDILVNVSGTNLRKPFEKYTPAEYDHLLSTNVHGLVELTQLIGAKMIARGKGGKVIFIGSLTSRMGLPYLSVYGITKGAVTQLTQGLAAEWGRHDIQVNCIAPGFIVTDLNRAMWQAPEMAQWLRGNQANPRLGRAEDIAPLAVFLSGKGSDYITGQVIPVDGGFTTTAVWPFEPS